jgi:hypothetical protein
VSAGNFGDTKRFILNPDYKSAMFYIGRFRNITNYDFPINKNFVSIDHIPISAFVQDLTDNVPAPYFEIMGGSALKIDQNSMVLRCADYGCGLIDDIDVTEDSYLANMLGARGSKVEISKEFNGADAVEITHIGGKYSKDISLYGNTSIKFGPGIFSADEKNSQMFFGFDMGGTRTDIVGHWKNFQAILSGNDSFINWDGNNHFESWSGT